MTPALPRWQHSPCAAPCPHSRDRSRRAWGLAEVPPPYNRAHAGEHSGGRELALADAARNVADHHARIGRARSGSDARLYKVQRHAILQSKEECTNPGQTVWKLNAASARQNILPYKPRQAV